MNRLRAAILAALLMLVATPARADKSFDFLLFCDPSHKLFKECADYYARRSLGVVPKLPHAPVPVPRPRPKPAPGQWDI